MRRARAEDARAIAEVHVLGWRTGYQDLFPRSYLNSLDVARHEHRWAQNLRDAAAGHLTVLVHEGDDQGGERVDGFATCGPTRDTDVPASTGEVYGLYVHPRSWSRGVGGALLGAAVAHLRRSGTRTAARPCADARGGRDGPLVLWTLRENHRARRFYARQGWVADGTERRDERPPLGDVPGIAFTEVRYRLP